ncbi:MAG: 50S ribosomal protein L3 [bacterium]|nr:50S ribosomal protein L3 [bacterium]
MKFILGKKLNMTQVFLPTGEVVPVTKVLAGPCQVVQIKTKGKDNSNAIQLSFGVAKEYHMKKPEAGHLKDLQLSRELQDFAVETLPAVERGDMVTVATFVPGDLVNVVGISKGKGFAGVVKRHHFRGGPASHGHKDNLRAPGSIGAGGVQRVFKGMRMAGQMGNAQITVKNLEIIEVHPETNEIYLKGAVPGGRNSVLYISGAGELKVQKSGAKVEAPAVVETVPELVQA